MNNIVIGIEGYVGAGKTSICRELVNRIENTVLLNGGNLYRAIVYAMMQDGKGLEELKKNIHQIDIKQMMDLFKINIKIENNETIIYMNDKKIDEELLQSQNSSIAVSTLGGSANNKNLFIFARNLINHLKESYNVIVSGRSIMKIYPGCDYHFFITASLDERVRRKCNQYNSNEYESVKENIVKRDKLQEEAGFYKLHDISTVIDVTECKNVYESTDKVISHIKELEIV